METDQNFLFWKKTHKIKFLRLVMQNNQ